LNVGELLEVCHQWLGNGIERPIGLTTASKINVRDAIRISEPAIACETIKDKGQTLIALRLHRPLEELINNSADNIL